MSVHPGEAVRLFVSTTAPSYTVTAFRIGDYPPTGGATDLGVAAAARPRASPTRWCRSRGTPSWRPGSRRSTVDTTGWPPGDYLFRLDASTGAQQFVPLTVATPDNTGRIVIVNAVTTWQAYNRWGGYSLYASARPAGWPTARARSPSTGPTRPRPCRAPATSSSSSGRWCSSPSAAGCRSATPPTSTCTPTRTCSTAPAAMVTLGHDEYWSQEERDNATAARDRGVNLAFLGGNEIYRHIRFEPSPLGANRVEVDYKVFEEDPVAHDRPGRGHHPVAQPAGSRGPRACCSGTSTSATRRTATWSPPTRPTGCCRASSPTGRGCPA